MTLIYIADIQFVMKINGRTISDIAVQSKLSDLGCGFM